MAMISATAHLTKASSEGNSWPGQKRECRGQLQSLRIGKLTASSKSRFIFYFETMPFLTIFHTITDLVLAFTCHLSPICALVGSVVFVAGWTIQVAFWIHCEWASGLYGVCYNFYVRDKIMLGTFEVPLASAKLAFAWLVIIS